jgi:hypothetical protein
VNIAFLASDVSKNGAARWLIFLHRLLVVMQILFGVMLILRIAPHRERGISQSGARGIENDAEEQSALRMILQLASWHANCYIHAR